MLSLHYTRRLLGWNYHFVLKFNNNEKLNNFVRQNHNCGCILTDLRHISRIQFFRFGAQPLISRHMKLNSSCMPIEPQPFHRHFTTSFITCKDSRKNPGNVQKSEYGRTDATPNKKGNSHRILDGDDADDDFDNLSELVDVQMHSAMLQQYYLEALDTQQLLVVQPVYRKGPLSRHEDTHSDLMLAETIGLVETLGWSVVDKIMLGTDCQKSGSKFFGTGQLEGLRDHIAQLESPTKKDSEGEESNQKRSYPKLRSYDEEELMKRMSKTPSTYISAVFVSTFRLSGRQRLQMEEILGKTVLDRYNVVLQIFKRHAKSREAKLQVELAEMPYLKARLHGDYELEHVSKHDPSVRKGESFFSTRRMVLARRERKIRSEIDQLRLHRAVIRKNRTRLQIPSVAVVGYTNAGKTSLIKALTGLQHLRPRNQLFATLDVTVHAYRLPSTLEILLIDTVGFISDIPTDLIASFNATLEDATLADVLLHVRDVANPDHSAQDNEVRRTLRQLDLPPRLLPRSDGNTDVGFEAIDLGRDVITVGNKIDLLEPVDWPHIKADGMIPVSCAKGYGLDYLSRRIEEAVMRATGRRKMLFRISIKDGSEQYSWLRKNTQVYDVTVDPENDNYWLVHAILKHFDLVRFEKQFIGKKSIETVGYE